MLQYREIEELLSHFSFMPGWFFTAMAHEYEGTWIAISVRMPNSYNEREMLDLQFNCPVPPCDTADDFYRWLVYRLCRIMTHETREWARVDGKAIDDPHVEITEQLRTY